MKSQIGLGLSRDLISSPSADVKTEVKRSGVERRSGWKAAMVFAVISSGVAGLVVGIVIERRLANDRALEMQMQVDASVTSAVKQSLQAAVGDMETRLSSVLAERNNVAATTGRETDTIGAVMRKVGQSLVQMWSYDKANALSFGTASYLGDGYFLTVKHGVAIPGENAAQQEILKVTLQINSKTVRARIVDMGDARGAVHSGDWAILRVKTPVDLPILPIDLDHKFENASQFIRAGNDYNLGMIAEQGRIGQRFNNLFTALADSHPGVSGGAVTNLRGELIGIPIGRQQPDFRFSYVLPLREVMFRKVPHLRR